MKKGKLYLISATTENIETGGVIDIMYMLK